MSPHVQIEYCSNKKPLVPYRDERRAHAVPLCFPHLRALSRRPSSSRPDNGGRFRLAYFPLVRHRGRRQISGRGSGMIFGPSGDPARTVPGFAVRHSDLLVPINAVLRRLCHVPLASSILLADPSGMHPHRGVRVSGVRPDAKSVIPRRNSAPETWPSPRRSQAMTTK